MEGKSGLPGVTTKVPLHHKYIDTLNSNLALLLEEAEKEGWLYVPDKISLFNAVIRKTGEIMPAIFFEEFEKKDEAYAQTNARLSSKNHQLLTSNLKALQAYAKDHKLPKPVYSDLFNFMYRRSLPLNKADIEATLF